MTRRVREAVSRRWPRRVRWGPPVGVGAAAALTATGLTVSAGTGTVALAVALTPSGQTVSAGTVALTLILPGPVGITTSAGTATLSTGSQAALTATGTTTSGGTGTVALAVALTASASTVSGGTVAFRLTVAGPVGVTTSGGTASLATGSQANLTATGTTTSGGTATATLAALLTATGQTTSAGTVALRLLLPGPVGTTTSGGTATLQVAGPPDAPDAILQAVNLTGPVDYLWEPLATPDPATWLTAPNPTTPTALRVSFPTPGVAPGSGGPTRFGLVLRRGVTGTDPTATLELWEAGVFRATLGSAVITSTVGQLVEVDFNPASLTVPDGSAAELRLTMT